MAGLAAGAAVREAAPLPAPTASAANNSGSDLFDALLMAATAPGAGQYPQRACSFQVALQHHKSVKSHTNGLNQSNCMLYFIYILGTMCSSVAKYSRHPIVSCETPDLLAL